MKENEKKDSKITLAEIQRKIKEMNTLLPPITKPKPLKRKRFTKKIRDAVLLLQNSRCKICGMILDVNDFDHIDGNHWNVEINNCQALCPTCHRRKTKNHKSLAKTKTIDFSSYMIEPLKNVSAKSIVEEFSKFIIKPSRILKDLNL